MSKDIPIIFSAPMVRALLEGRKTQTRRTLKDVPEPPAMDNVRPGGLARHSAPYLDAYCTGCCEVPIAENPRGMSRNWCWWTRDDRPGSQFNVRYAPGDRLWVREAVAWINNSEFGKPSYWEYRAETNGQCLPGDWPDEFKDDPDRPRWKPSIHMPRWASRLTLLVTGVRVERLQDISQQDVFAEGLHNAEQREYQAAAQRSLSSVECFKSLWQSLHGSDSWDQNPFVVAITFRIIKANIDAPEARAAA